MSLAARSNLSVVDNCDIGELWGGVNSNVSTIRSLEVEEM
jgi:hypothetical protein